VYAPKPFEVHSNELVNDKYCYNWSVTWWISRKTGKPVTEAVMLEIERLLTQSGDLNYEGLEDMNILFTSGCWMFVDSNGMVIQHRTPDVVDTMEVCNTKAHYNPSLLSTRKPSTMLTYKDTKECHEEIVVEKPERTYSDLTAKRGDDNTESIVDKWEPSSDYFFGIEKKDVQQYDACHERTSPSLIRRGRESNKTTTKDQYKVMVIKTKQRTVGLQAPQVLMDLIIR
jgi:hypothetical protein